MIQRIQTIFILLAAILAGLLFFLPIAEISANSVLYVFKAQGILYGTEVVISGLPLLIFLGIIVVLHLIVIFMYKKRIRQIRVLVFTMILLIGLFGIFYYFTYAGFKEATIGFKVSAGFPLVAVVLDYLAIRNIGRDEALIRSLDRIR